MATKTRSRRRKRLVDQSFSEVLTRVGRDLSRTILTTAPDARAGLDEGIHQQRVAVRRLRSLIRCCEPVLRTDEIALLAEDLSWLGSALGASRDVDVLDSHLRSAIDALGDDDHRDVSAHVQAHLRQLSDSADAQLAAVFASDRYAALEMRLETLDLGALVAEDSDGCVEKVANRLIHRSWRRLARSVDRMSYESDIAEWHRVRTKAKKLRYVVDVFVPIYGKDYERLGRRLAAVTDELGEQRDSYACALALRDIADDVDPHLAFELGQVAAAQNARVQTGMAAFAGSWTKVRIARRAVGF